MLDIRRPDEQQADPCLGTEWPEDGFRLGAEAKMADQDIRLVVRCVVAGLDGRDQGGKELRLVRGENDGAIGRAIGGAIGGGHVAVPGGVRSTRSAMAASWVAARCHVKWVARARAALLMAVWSAGASSRPRTPAAISPGWCGST